jgi:hypothetical protein
LAKHAFPVVSGSWVYINCSEAENESWFFLVFLWENLSLES